MNICKRDRLFRYAEMERIYKLKLPDCLPKKDLFMILNRRMLPSKRGLALSISLPRYVGFKDEKGMRIVLSVEADDES